ncbi:MAG: C-terminal binding protein [Chloroflexi bacterium]|nr:C-terminal binding protein [Chloroflexota bacterium]
MSEVRRKVLIIDRTWEGLAVEHSVLDPTGAEIVVAPSHDEATLVALVPDMDAIIYCFAPITDNVLRAAAKCRIAARYGIGFDNIDRKVADELGIILTNVPDYCVDEVADHAMTMLLAYNRELVLQHQAVKTGGWGSRPLPAHTRRLRDTTLGIVGVGRIGRAVFKRAVAFGMRVIGCDPYIDPGLIPEGIELVALDRLLGESDFVSVHTPLTDETRSMFGAEQFRTMKKEALFINTARGPIVDGDALVAALKSGEIAAASLDVTPLEPPPVGYELLTLDNLTVTPHSAFLSRESLAELQRRTAGEVARVLNGEMPENVVNPEVLGHTRAAL